MAGANHDRPKETFHRVVYGDEEEAAVDYARALLKYKGQGALEKAMR